MSILAELGPQLADLLAHEGGIAVHVPAFVDFQRIGMIALRVARIDREVGMMPVEGNRNQGDGAWTIAFQKMQDAQAARGRLRGNTSRGLVPGEGIRPKRLP